MREHQKSWPNLIITLPALNTPHLTKKLAFNVLNNMPRNPTFCSFVSFSIVSSTPVINKSESSSD